MSNDTFDQIGYAITGALFILGMFIIITDIWGM